MVDIQKEGPKVLMDLPEKKTEEGMTTDTIALIDEISGLNNHMEGIL